MVFLTLSYAPALVLLDGKQWVYTKVSGQPERLGQTLLENQNANKKDLWSVVEEKHFIIYDFDKNAFIDVNGNCCNYKGPSDEDLVYYVYDIRDDGVYFKKFSENRKLKKLRRSDLGKLKKL